MKNSFIARLSGLAAVTAGFFVTSNAFAVDGITTALAAVDLSGVTTGVVAAALIVVAIALVFKGPDIAKRVIKKV